MTLTASNPVQWIIKIGLKMLDAVLIDSSTGKPYRTEQIHDRPEALQHLAECLRMATAMPCVQENSLMMARLQMYIDVLDPPKQQQKMSLHMAAQLAKAKPRNPVNN